MRLGKRGFFQKAAATAAGLVTLAGLALDFSF
jgi:hypothetical protein